MTTTAESRTIYRAHVHSGRHYESHVTVREMYGVRVVQAFVTGPGMVPVNGRTIVSRGAFGDDPRDSVAHSLDRTAVAVVDALEAAYAAGQRSEREAV